MAKLPFEYKWIGSPNYSRGRLGFKVKYIVIHWMVGNLKSTDAVFQNRRIKTSAHYGVENKKVHQYVKEKDTAYHAGKWTANLQSIGIEHSAAPGRAPTAQTYETSAQLIARICKAYKLNPDKAIVPHCKFVATRCPGTDPNGKVDEKGGVDIGRLKKRVKEILNPPKPKPVKKPSSKTPKGQYDVLRDLPGYVTAADAVSGKRRVNTVKKGRYYVYNRTDKARNVTKKKGVPGSWIKHSSNKR